MDRCTLCSVEYAHLCSWSTFVLLRFPSFFPFFHPEGSILHAQSLSLCVCFTRHLWYPLTRSLNRHIILAVAPRHGPSTEMLVSYENSGGKCVLRCLLFLKWGRDIFQEMVVWYLQACLGIYIYIYIDGIFGFFLFTLIRNAILITLLMQKTNFLLRF